MWGSVEKWRNEGCWVWGCIIAIGWISCGWVNTWFDVSQWMGNGMGGWRGLMWGSGWKLRILILFRWRWVFCEDVGLVGMNGLNVWGG